MVKKLLIKDYLAKYRAIIAASRFSSPNMSFSSINNQEAIPIPGDLLCLKTYTTFRKLSSPPRGQNHEPSLSGSLELEHKFSEQDSNRFGAQLISVSLLSLTKTTVSIVVTMFIRLKYIANPEAKSPEDYLDPWVEATYDENLFRGGSPANLEAHYQMFANFLPSLMGSNGSMDIITDAMAEMKDILPDVQDTTLSLKSLLERINTNFSDETKEDITKKFDSKFAQLTEAVNPGNIVDGIVPLVLIASFVWFAKERDLPSLALFAGLSAYAISRIKGAIELLMSVGTNIIGIFKSNKEATFQGVAPTDVSQSIVSMLIAGLFSGIPEIEQNSKKVLKNVGDFNKYSSSFESVFVYIMKVIRYIVTLFRLDDYLPDTVKYAGISADAIKDFAASVDDIQDAVQKRVFPITRSNYSKLTELKKTGNSMLLSLGRNQGDSKVMSDYLSLLNGLIKLFRAKLNLSDNKPEPRLYRFAGGSGNFKSQLLQHLATALVVSSARDEEIEHLRDNPMSQVYNMLEANGYADGYTMDKKVVIIDDIDQLQVVPGDPDCIAMKIISMIGELAYPLHMAGVEDKGNVVFNSSFIITSSNLEMVRSNCLISQEALQRRFSMCWYVVPRDEYAKSAKTGFMQRKINIDSLPFGDLNLTSSAPEVLQFIPYDCKTGHTLGIPPMDFSQVVSHIMDDYDKSRSYFAQKILDLKKRATEYESVRETRRKKNVDPITHLTEFIDSMVETTVAPPSPDSTLTDSLFSEIPEVPGLIDENDFPDTEKEVAEIKDLLTREIATFQGRLSNKYGKIKDDEDFSEYLEMIDMNPEDLGQIENYLIDMAELSDKDDLTQDERNCYVGFTNFCRFYKSSILGDLTISVALATFTQQFPDEAWQLLENESQLGKCDWQQEFIDLCVGINPVTVGFVPKWYEKGYHNAISWYTLAKSIFFRNFPVLAKGVAFLTFTFISWKAVRLFIRGAVYVSRTIMSYFFPDKEADAVFENSDYAGKLYRYSKKGSIIVKEAKPAEHQMGGKTDPSGCQKIDSIIGRNFYSINFVVDRGGKPCNEHQVFGLAVNGHALLVNYHFIRVLQARVDDKEDEMNGNARLVLIKDDRRQNRREPMEFLLREILDNVKTTEESIVRDICLVDLPPRFHLHSNIIQRFMPRKTLESLKGRPHQIRIINIGGVKGQMGISKMNIISDFKVSGNVIPEGFTYDLPTEDGDCGSIVHILNSSVNISGMIPAIHLAGLGGNRGLATWTPKELIEELFAKCKSVKQEIVDDLASFQGNFIKHGLHALYKSPIISGSPNATKFHPTELCGLYGPPQEAPARLRDFINEQGVLVSPRDMSLKGYSPSDVYFGEETTMLVVDQVFRDIRANSSIKITPQVYSFEVACQGNPDIPYFEPIKRQTSPGWPFVKNCVRPGKYDFFGEDELFTFTSDACLDLRLRVENIISKAKSGERLQHLYADHLKDETRPLSRVAIGKTRNFSSMPLDLNVAYRMYFMSFVIDIMTNHIHNGCLPGTNPYSDEWHFLGMKQTSKGKGKNCFAGDFSGFDKAQFRRVSQSFIIEINKFYNDGPENARIREILWYELTHSRHIVEDTVFEWVGSLPSGNVLTTIVNCLYNLFLHYHCWFELHNYHVPSLLTFTDHISLVVYGDDSHGNATDYAIKIFNEMTLPKLMLTCGAVYTNETKLEATTFGRTLYETNLLKRTWRLDPIINRYVAPLRLDTIKQMLYFSRIGDNFIAGTLATIDIALKEFSLHGRDVFNENAPILIECSEEIYGYTPQMTNYLKLLRVVCACPDFY